MEKPAFTLSIKTPLMNQPDSVVAAARKGRSFARSSKKELRIDMTPMVDLGFLLISFFVITTELSQPKAMHFISPKDSRDSMAVKRSVSLTLLLGRDNKIFYYEGDWNTAINNDEVLPTDYSAEGLRKVIAGKRERVGRLPGLAAGKDELMVIVKPTAASCYKNVVDALDEMNIGMVKRYALTAISSAEADWMSRHQ